MPLTDEDVDWALGLVVKLRSVDADRWRAAVREAEAWGPLECRVALTDSDWYRALPGTLRLAALLRPGTRLAAAWVAELAGAAGGGTA